MELRNPHDVHRWIIKVIQSCERLEQLGTCHELIDNFSMIYPGRDNCCFRVEQRELWNEKFDFFT